MLLTRSSLLSLATVALALGAGAFGCSSDPPTEPEGSVREAICSGGGGGGDECVYQSGYCPASCSMCFNSMNERIQLQNMWECTPWDTGGGGGGGDTGGATCSQCQTEYTQCTQNYYRCVDLVNICRPRFYACTDRISSTARCSMPGDFCNR